MFLIDLVFLEHRKKNSKMYVCSPNQGENLIDLKIHQVNTSTLAEYPSLGHPPYLFLLF